MAEFNQHEIDRLLTAVDRIADALEKIATFEIKRVGEVVLAGVADPDQPTLWGFPVSTKPDNDPPSFTAG